VNTVRTASGRRLLPMHNPVPYSKKMNDQQRVYDATKRLSVEKPTRKPPRPYFARLDPTKDLKKQMAARIVQFLCAESDGDGRVIYMKMYHSLHGNRYRDRNGEDVWAEALKYLRQAICRKHGFIWIDRTEIVPDLPSPYKLVPKFTQRKRKHQTKWYKDVAERAQANELSISEQIEADRQGRVNDGIRPFLTGPSR
jgi:hypothetical protein